MIHRGIFSLLRDDAGVGAIAGDRIYPQVAPRDAAEPYIVYQRVSRVDLGRDLDGANELVQARVQVDSYADGYNTARNLADAIRRRLDGYKGTVDLTGSPSETLRIGGISLIEDRDDFDDSVKPKLHRVIQDYLCIFEEPPA